MHSMVLKAMFRTTQNNNIALNWGMGTRFKYGRDVVGAGHETIQSISDITLELVCAKDDILNASEVSTNLVATLIEKSCAHFSLNQS